MFDSNLELNNFFARLFKMLQKDVKLILKNKKQKGKNNGNKKEKKQIKENKAKRNKNISYKY